ncbi:alpha/beta fold hydrolase [Streptomyces sp. NPDC003077]|uniref:dienelactone hydrolase family protein n=1 Tax=Streptomyces sp. NPDC003077 TaxID=3154443 RepID=UPI0033BC16F4
MGPEAGTVHIDADGATLVGDLAVPEEARGVVGFAHGSGSSRHSPRNRSVAEVLRRAGLGTLVLDLLTSEEERVDMATAELRFDVPMLARRMVAAIDWLAGRASTGDLPVGLFGASTGAAAALTAAAERPERVRSVVSRGGRPDLAGAALTEVRAPVLLVVGGEDREVLRLNQQAAERLTAPYAFHVVSGATHLFEETGALEEVATAARDWFVRMDGEAA